MEHMKSPIPSLQAARKDVPTALDAVFNRMLAKVAADRQANMAQVITELNAAVKGLRCAGCDLISLRSSRQQQFPAPGDCG